MFWFAVLTASAAYLAVITGAVSTSSRGWSLPGGLIQKWAEIEDVHRFLAYLAVALTLVLAAALLLKEKRRWLKTLGGLAALGVVAQAALGRLEVRRLDLPLALSHSCLAQIYFCLVVSLAVFTHPKWRWEGPEAALGGKRSLRLVAVGFSIIVFAQIVLGAIYRDEAQISSGGVQGIGVLPHIIGGGIVLAAALWLLVSVLNLPARETSLMVLTVSLAIFVMVQVFLGIGVYMMMRFAGNAPRALAAGSSAPSGPILPIVIATVMHAALGTLIFTGSVAATYMAYRRPATSRSLTAEP